MASNTLILDLWPNHGSPGICAGLSDALSQVGGATTRLHESDLPPSPEAQAEFLRRVMRDLDPSHVIIMGSALRLVGSERAFRLLLPSLSERIVVYWEGDAWGRGKRHNESMRRWMRAADHVFHTGGIPEIRELASTATGLHFAPNAYCHIQFATAEEVAPTVSPSRRVSLIANNVTKTRIPLPGLTGLPDGLARYGLARQLIREFGPEEVALFGRDWPRAWSPGPIAFGDQWQAIRSTVVSTNWDHFSSYPRYSSDRLPISLISGRPHVTTRHRDMTWAPGTAQGLFLEPTPAAVLSRTIELATDPPRSFQLGLEAWSWARFRISTRQLALFLLSRVRADVEGPDFEPWSDLPTAEIGFAEPLRD